MDQIGSLESKSEHQPFRISRAKVTQKTDEILIVADGSLKFNPTIFTTDGVLADEAPAPKQKTPSSAPSLFDVRHKQATATAPVQTTLTKK
jgi:hypothetical protein